MSKSYDFESIPESEAAGPTQTMARDIGDAAEVEDLGDLNLPDRIRQIIEDGQPEFESDTYAGPSEARMAAITGMIHAGVSDEQILGVLLNEDFAIHHRSNGKVVTEKFARDEIARAHAKTPSIADDFKEPIDPKWLKNDPEVEVTKAKAKIKASLFVPRDPREIPPRDFILRPGYVRQFLSLSTAMGGTGKSRIVMTEAVVIACGRPLLGVEPIRALKVWYWNGEDPADEIERGFAAILKRYDVSADDLGQRLFADSGRAVPIKLATLQNGKATIAIPVVDALIAEIKRLGIDVLIIDPFVASHSVSENDNDEMEMVAKKWAHIADECNISVMLVHHNRKTGGGVGTVEDARGATAINYASRIRRAFNTMTEAQAKAGGIDAGRRRFFVSADLSQSNLLKPATALTWYELDSISLENATLDQPSDELGVPVVYSYVVLAAVETTPDQDAMLLAALRKRDKWRADQRSPEWIGNEIGKLLDYPVLAGDDHKLERARVKKIIADWVEDGTLIPFVDEDENRHKRDFLRVASVASVVASVSDAD